MSLNKRKLGGLLYRRTTSPSACLLCMSLQQLYIVADICRGCMLRSPWMMMPVVHAKPARMRLLCSSHHATGFT